MLAAVRWNALEEAFDGKNMLVGISAFVPITMPPHHHHHHHHHPTARAAADSSLHDPGLCASGHCGKAWRRSSPRPCGMRDAVFSGVIGRKGVSWGGRTETHPEPYRGFLRKSFWPRNPIGRLVGRACRVQMCGRSTERELVRAVDCSGGRTLLSRSPGEELSGHLIPPPDPLFQPGVNQAL
ncbi:hypothetical protein AAFF_G00165020 [Aldrovandia affinis]|uniref:Uncharacterized protein n=1 Tax=Aldrovandia affinis TaxID=143900 RepID=A0AAD7RMP8_9TELE|nr:hypothetical protein AAFF_G00165020 [Aldrovandia affinis]